MFWLPQIVARTSTKLTPSQLEEFESTFRHFDKDQENKLGVNEFSAALSALGIIYSDEDTLAIHDQLSQGDEDQKVSFQAWIDFLVGPTVSSLYERLQSAYLTHISSARPTSLRIRLPQIKCASRSLV